MNVPDVIFIIPYRDRRDQLVRWVQTMGDYLDGIKYEVIVVHQVDKRRFNRGAMKNHGFLRVKEQYPDHYKTITLVFNDVDTIPVKPLDFRVSRGTVKHFFGFRFAFGGLFSMTAGDFEQIGGFPNLWSWGLEDNLVKERWVKHFGEDSIDFSQFVELRGKNREDLSDEILFDTSGEKTREIEVQVGQYVNELRPINEHEHKMKTRMTESIHSIRRVRKHMVPLHQFLPGIENSRIHVCNIVHFDCGTTDNGLYEKRHDTRKIRRQKILTMRQLMRYRK